MNINSIKPKILIISIAIIISFVALIAVLIFVYNSLDFEQKYMFKLKKARNLLQDNYSKEVFDYGVDYLGSNSEFTPKYRRKFIELSNKEYTEMRNPNIPINIGDTVVDGGLSKGQKIEDLFYEMIGPKGKIIGFEPDIIAIPTIESQLKHYNNVSIYPYGLWKSNTTMKLWRFENQMENTVKKNWLYKRSNSHATDCINAKFIKLDDFVKENNIKKIDYIRLNIEGSELEALMGAKNTIKAMKPKFSIVLEHHPTQLFSIILYLDSLKSGYKFYLGLHNFRKGITLYAIAK